MTLSVNAQSTTEDRFINDILESVAENLPENYDLTELVERLNRLKKSPLNINTASLEDFNQLLFLSPIQINNLLKHIKENGPIIDLLELQTIDELDVLTIKHLALFAGVNPQSVNDKITLKNLMQLGESDWLFRFGQTTQRENGFQKETKNAYQGGPERIQSRLKYYFKDRISASLVIDKDAGEQFIQKPFDFVSTNVSINKVGRFDKIVVGDYSLQFGQGLTLWSGFAFGKGADITSIAKKDLGLRPYSSSNEYSFFRGFSSSIALNNYFRVTPFISFRNYDANQNVDVFGNLVQATINQTGLHRTLSEIENKNSLNQTIYGAALQYITANLNVGTIAYHTRFSHAFVQQNSPYDAYSFTGKNLTNLGIHYNYTYKNMYIFGELANGLTNSYAHINGIIMSVAPTVSLALQYRNYPKDYHNFYNQALSESSEATNERGLYAGINLQPFRKISLAFYTDYFKYGWLKFRVDAPSEGYELLLQSIYSHSKTFKILGRYKTEIKQQNTDNPSYFNALEEIKKSSYRLQVDWQMNSRLKFQNRLEISDYKKGQQNQELGYLIYQDLNYQPSKSKFRGNIRVAYFYTPSYNSRIYAYEDDVLYSFSFGLYSGKGLRNYLNLNYSPTKNLNIWARYGLYYYPTVIKIGSGLGEIEGNKKSDFKMQMRYQF